MTIRDPWPSTAALCMCGRCQTCITPGWMLAPQVFVGGTLDHVEPVRLVEPKPFRSKFRTRHAAR